MLGPGAVAASADTLSVTAQRVLTMTGTNNSSTVTVGPATKPGYAYRFTTTAPSFNVAASDFCDPPEDGAVECVDDLTPDTPGDDIASIVVDARGGADDITALGPLPTADSVTLIGGAGDDAIAAQDGAVEDIHCDGVVTSGAGTNDTVLADSIDTVAPDCEHQTITSPPPPPPAAPPPAPPPLVLSAVSLSGPPIAIGFSAAFEVYGHGTRVKRLTVRDVPAAIVLHVVCSSPAKLRGGAKCPFKTATIPVVKATSRVALSSRFKYRRLAPHTIIRVFGVAFGRVGTSVAFTIRKGGPPARSDGCVDLTFKRISCLGSALG